MNIRRDPNINFFYDTCTSKFFYLLLPTFVKKLQKYYIIVPSRYLMHV